MPAPKITMGSVPDANPRLLLPNLQLVLTAWMERHNDATFPWEPPKPEEVEIGFSYPLEKDKCVCGSSRSQHKKVTLPTGKIRRGEALDNGDCPKYQELQYAGKMDLLPRSRENNRAHVPVDHKSTYEITISWARQWQLDSQMTGYIWAARQYSGEPVDTFFINGIGLKEVPTSNRTCKEHQVEYAECGPLHLKFEIVGPVQRSDRQVERWVLDTQRQAANYRKALLTYHLGKHRAMPMEGTWRSKCGYCEFQDWCEDEQPTNMEQHGYFKKAWSPINHAMPGSKPKGGVFYIDNSTLRAQICTSLAVARYGWDMTRIEQAGSLRAGIALHAGLEAYFKGKSAHRCLKALEEGYNERTQGGDE